MWAPLRAAGIVSRLTVLTVKRTQTSHPHIHFHSILKDLFEIGSLDSYSPSCVAEKDGKKHFEFNFVSASWTEWGLFSPCSSLLWVFLYLQTLKQQTRAHETAKCTKLQENFAS